MRHSAYMKAIFLGIVALACLCVAPASRADIADIPRLRANVFHSGDSFFAQALEQAGYKIVFSYNLRHLLAQNPSIPNSYLSAEEASQSVQKRCVNAEKRQNFQSEWLSTVTSNGHGAFAGRTYVKEINSNYLKRSANQNGDSKFGREFLSAYSHGKVNLDKPCSAIVATRKDRKNVFISKETKKLADLSVQTSITPVALLQQGKQIYIGFLDYDLKQVDVDEDEPTGRFGPNTLNFSCAWKRIYFLPIDALISK